MKPTKTRRLWWITACVFLAAAIIRLWGIRHDLPYTYYPDEAHFIKRALSFGSGDFNPHWFHKPAFYMYLLFVEYGLFYVFGRVAGSWSSVTDFAVSYILNPSPFILIGRVTTFAFGMMSIWGVYRIGEKHIGKYVGLISALFLALTYGHIAACRDVKADIPSACLSVWSAYFLMDYCASKRTRDLLLSCICAGIGAAAKFYAVVMLGPILVAALNVSRDESLLRALTGLLARSCLAIACFMAAFFVCSPYSLLDELGRRDTLGRLGILSSRLAEVRGDDSAEEPGDFIKKQSGYIVGAFRYVKTILAVNGMGPVIGAIALVGLLVTFPFRNPERLVFYLFPILFSIVSIIAYPGYAETRHQLPVYTFLVVPAAALVVTAASYATRPVLVYAPLALAMLQPLWSVSVQAADLARKDTRNVAKAWIESNLPAGTKLLVTENGPPLVASAESLRSQLRTAERASDSGQFTAHYDTYLRYQLLAADQCTTYDVTEIRFPWWRQEFRRVGQHRLDSEYDRDIANPLLPVGVETFEYYVKNGFDYAIVHSDYYLRFLHNQKYRERFPAFRDFYEDLLSKGELVVEFSPNQGLRGPVVRVYRFARDP